MKELEITISQTKHGTLKVLIDGELMGYVSDYKTAMACVAGHGERIWKEITGAES
jgi:hypothetical protein